MIELRDISKSYSQGDTVIEVLRGLDLRCAAGEFLSLMGASGAGKSTLLQILGCLDTPSSGSYRLQNADLSSCSERELARVRNQRIGFVFQSSHFVDYLSLVDNVALPALYEKGRIAGPEQDRAQELLTQVGLEHRAGHLPAALSGGERQRAAVARALFNKPGVILADEPTGNLDAENAARIMALLRHMQGSRSALIVVTHDSRIAAQAEQRLRLRNGHLEHDLAAVA